LILVRANRTTRRAARERRKTLDQYPDGMTHELREILSQQTRNDLWGGGRFIRPY